MMPRLVIREMKRLVREAKMNVEPTPLVEQKRTREMLALKEQKKRIAEHVDSVNKMTLIAGDEMMIVQAPLALPVPLIMVVAEVVQVVSAVEIQVVVDLVVTGKN